MGIAKVLLGRGSKETGISRCARVDSLGLARRRLAAKHEERLGPDSVGPVEGVPDRDRDEGPEPEDPLDQDLKDEPEAVLLSLMSRQHRDSLRIHRRRFRERASLDLRGLGPRARDGFPENGASWSNGGQVGQDNEQYNDGDDSGGAGSGPGPTAPEHHVRFRRASDGEYLTSIQSRKSHEGGLPHALKAVQLKAERLFRRLTANFTEPQSAPSRPQWSSATPGSSPTRPQWSSPSRGGSTSASRPSSAWALGLLNRSVDAGSSSPKAAAASAAADVAGAAATSGGRRFRVARKSAPGELFFSPILVNEATGVLDPNSPPVQQLCASSVTKPRTGAAGSSVGKSRNNNTNWLSRLSRGLSSATASSSSIHNKPAAVAPGGGGGGGCQAVAAVSSGAAPAVPGPAESMAAAVTGAEYQAGEPVNGWVGGGDGGDTVAASAVAQPVAPIEAGGRC